jgi:hypothetical protein
MRSMQGDDLREALLNSEVFLETGLPLNSVSLFELRECQVNLVSNETMTKNKTPSIYPIGMYTEI